MLWYHYLMAVACGVANAGALRIAMGNWLSRDRDRIIRSSFPSPEHHLKTYYMFQPVERESGSQYAALLYIGFLASLCYFALKAFFLGFAGGVSEKMGGMGPFYGWCGLGIISWLLTWFGWRRYG